MQTVTDSAPFPSVGGEMGELIRSYDWSTSPLGSSNHWPLSLRTLVQMMLSSRFPMLIFWGPELITFYNDAFRPSLGNNGKHPSSLGQPGEVSWAESWPVIGPMIYNIMAGGEAVWFEDQKLPIYREGQMGYAYWTYSFSPLSDDAGAVGGVLVTCSETTKAVESQQQLVASEGFAKSLLANSPVASMVFTGPDMVIRSSNDAMLTMLGRDRSIIGLPFVEALPELKPTPLLTRLQRVLRTGQPYHQTEEPIHLIRYGQPYTGYYNYIYSILPAPTGEPSGVMVTAIEVTQQVLARRRIEESQEQLIALLDQSPVAVAIISQENLTIQRVNSFYCQLVDRPAQDLINKPLLEALPELQGQKVDQRLRQVIETGIPVAANEASVELVRKGNLETIYVNLAYQPRREADNSISGVFVIATDVTSQVRSRQAVEMSEARFRALMEQSPVAICLYVGRDLVIDLANERMIQTFGKGHSVLGKPLAQALPELKDQLSLSLLDQVFTTGTPYVGQGMRFDLIVNGQLEVGYFDFTYQPIRNAEGEVYAIMKMAVNVTEDIFLRRQYEQTRQALQNAVDLAQLGIWKIDVATQSAEFSQLVEDWVGSTERLTLQAAIAAIDPADLPHFDAAFRQAYLAESGGRLEVEYRLKNARTGQVYLLHSMGQAEFDENGNPLSISGFSQDVTQLRANQLALEIQVRERTQELLRANQDLLRSNDNLQQFAYVASHDLQEPLRKIQSFSSLLMQQFEGRLDESALNYLQRISSAGSRMSKLIKDLLAYSRISTRQQTFSPVPLRVIMDEVLMTLDWEIQQTGAQIQVDELPTVNGDPAQLSQLFQNLLTNAMKFVGPDQTPKVRVQYTCRAVDGLPADVQPSQHAAFYHQISVHDQGVGFDPKYLGRIFQVFQRLHNKDQFPGTGVGLAICKQVVENHGGAITARSEPDQGTTFSIFLPA